MASLIHDPQEISAIKLGMKSIQLGSPIRLGTLFISDNNEDTIYYQVVGSSVLEQYASVDELKENHSDIELSGYQIEQKIFDTRAGIPEKASTDVSEQSSVATVANKKNKPWIRRNIFGKLIILIAILGGGAYGLQTIAAKQQTIKKEIGRINLSVDSYFLTARKDTPDNYYKLHIKEIIEHGFSFGAYGTDYILGIHLANNHAFKRIFTTAVIGKTLGDSRQYEVNISINPKLFHWRFMNKFFEGEKDKLPHKILKAIDIDSLGPYFAIMTKVSGPIQVLDGSVVLNDEELINPKWKERDISTEINEELVNTALYWRHGFTDSFEDQKYENGFFTTRYIVPVETRTYKVKESYEPNMKKHFSNDRLPFRYGKNDQFEHIETVRYQLELRVASFDKSGMIIQSKLSNIKKLPSKQRVTHDFNQ